MKLVLEELKLHALIETFEKEKVDIQCFTSLSDPQLERLGMVTIGDRIRLNNRVLVELQKEQEAASSSTVHTSGGVVDDQKRQLKQSQLIKDISNQRNVLFGKGKRKSYKRPLSLPNEDDEATSYLSFPTGKKKKKTFEHGQSQ